MRVINHIVVHCTATQPNAKVESIVRYWRVNLGWKSPGYHYLIEADGTINHLHPEEKPSNGVAGHNHDSIHMSYIGGIDTTGKAKDTRTDAQRLSMLKLLLKLKIRYPNAQILGHRDFAGVNKACPSFDVNGWINSL